MIHKESENAAKKKKEVLGQRVQPLPSLNGMSKYHTFLTGEIKSVKIYLGAYVIPFLLGEFNNIIELSFLYISKKMSDTENGEHGTTIN